MSDRDQHIPAVRERVHKQQLGSTAPGVYALTSGIAEGMVTKHLLREMGYEVTLVNHVDSQSAKAWASKRGLGRMKRVMLYYKFVQNVVEKKQTILACLNTSSNQADLMTKCHTFEAHMKRCVMFGLKISRDDGKLALTSHSDARSGQKCLGLKRACGEWRTFSAANFTVSSEFTCGDNKFIIFNVLGIWLTVILLRISPTLTFTLFCIFC